MSSQDTLDYAVGACCANFTCRLFLACSPGLCWLVLIAVLAVGFLKVGSLPIEDRAKALPFLAVIFFGYLSGAIF